MRGAQAGRGEGGLHQRQRELGCEARRLVLLLRRPQLRQPFQLLQVRCNKRRLHFRGGAVLGFQMQWRLVVGLEIRRLDLHQIRLQRTQLCQQDGMFPMQCTEGLQ
ncbi:hypothetical protein BHM03_00011967 [Ensete ventricosum]|nr:hypothetical protein BHM03_00011967 [Ensete ventricosum]